MIVLGDVQQGGNQILQHRLRFPAGDLGVHACVEGYLIVPAAAGMQALAGLADPFRQEGFHIHVDILRIHHPLNPTGPGILQNSLQPFHDLLRVLPGNDSLLAQHGRVGDGAGDILLEEPLIKGNT